MRLAAREWKFDFPRTPIVMGIVNLGADSFSGDGLPDLNAALARSRSMIEAGAEIIDVGAESARTNREPIGEDEESERLCAFIKGWNEAGPGRTGRALHQHLAAGRRPHRPPVRWGDSQ